jgi:hypothetical protein
MKVKREEKKRREHVNRNVTGIFNANGNADCMRMKF